MAQWERICLPTQRTRIRSSHGKTPHAAEQLSLHATTQLCSRARLHNPWAHVLQGLCPGARALWQENHRRGRPPAQPGGGPAHGSQRKASSHEGSAQPKQTTWNKQSCLPMKTHLAVLVSSFYLGFSRNPDSSLHIPNPAAIQVQGQRHSLFRACPDFPRKMSPYLITDILIK